MPFAPLVVTGWPFILLAVLVEKCYNYEDYSAKNVFLNDLLNSFLKRIERVFLGLGIVFGSVGCLTWYPMMYIISRFERKSEPQIPQRDIFVRRVANELRDIDVDYRLSKRSFKSGSLTVLELRVPEQTDYENRILQLRQNSVYTQDIIDDGIKLYFEMREDENDGRMYKEMPEIKGPQQP